MNTIAGINALNAYGVRQQVNAHNVANVNTSNFTPSRVTMEEVSNQQGVRVQEIKKEDNNLNMATREEQRVQQTSENPSKTDLATEFTQMIENKNAYNANAQSIRVNDQMTGEIINKLA